jgi:uncharacterized protein YlxW (UPF0749 family)
MKLNQWLIGTIIGTQFAFTSLAADDAATNSTEAAEIEALRQEVRQLDQKVEDLENQHQAEPQTNTNAEQAQIIDLDQKVRILERQR